MLSSTRKLNIGYFADGPWSHGALQLLIADPVIEIAFICARYKDPDQYLREFALQHLIPFFVVQDVNSPEFIASLHQHRCDLFVSMSFDQIFRERLFTYPRLGTINCHAGKLPFYRGRNILNWALINNEDEFGITVHYIDDGIDTGDIILQRTYPITDSDDYASLLNISYKECPSVLYDAIKRIASGTSARIPQVSIHPCGSVCTQRGHGDETIDWNQTSREIFNFIRALTAPGPISTTELNGSLVKIVRAELIPEAPNYKGIPGAILAKDTTGFLVKTSDSFIRITEWISDTKLMAGKRFAQ